MLHERLFGLFGMQDYADTTGSLTAAQTATT
jgi:hypothetical protein